MSGEIDRFFNAHRGLPKPRGITRLDQCLKQVRHAQARLGNQKLLLHRGRGRVGAVTFNTLYRILVY